MAKTIKEKALYYHATGKPGKIEVIPTKPYSTQYDLSLAYSPGVAEPCLVIKKNSEKAYDYTAKGNLVAVISNGTAVLGLGDIGALSSKPVMEGKSLLFKVFAGIDVFDIEIKEKRVDKFVEAVKAIAPTFGGINLEDIKAPECFEIERRLKKELDIPVMHDDQHGTAIISSAGLINALEIIDKKIENIKIVVNGAGAAAIACTHLYIALGAKKENIIMCDSKGVISIYRSDLTLEKKNFASKRKIYTLNEALIGADVFLGLSVANVLTENMVRSMSDNPIVFALANPNPEISYQKAKASRADIIFATGRSDYPNQVNNVLGFPYIFRGALDTRATTINENMKLAAVKAIANLAKEAVPDVVNTAYGLSYLNFGREYLIPKPMDPRLLTRVSIAVAKAAIQSGVAKKIIPDWEQYENYLQDLMGYDNKLIRQLTEIASKTPKRVVFAEGSHENMLKAAAQIRDEKIAYPILLGNDERIAKLAIENHIDLEGIEIINLRHDTEMNKRHKYAALLAKKRAREGATLDEAIDKMFERNYFGMMMVETGDADAFITGVYTKYSNTIKVAKELIGIREGHSTFATMHILTGQKRTYFLADTLVNRHPSTDDLIDIAKLTAETVHFFAQEPIIAGVSYSNFGSYTGGSPARMHEMVRVMQKAYPNLLIDGEMQVGFALDKALRDHKYPFNRLFGKDVNTLIFPNLSSANIAQKLLHEMKVGEIIGPIQMGLKKPIHFTDIASSVRDIVNIAIVAVVDAIVMEKLQSK